MSDLMTFVDTPSAISSPASADGRSRFDSPAGLMTDLFGPVPVPANLSPRQARELGLLMSGTYGQPGFISSASAGLQQSLASRLQARTALLGSTLFRLTWKAWATPARRSLSRLRASALRTSETDCTSWPTPTTPSGGQVAPRDVEQMLRRRQECKERTGNGNGFGLTLGQATCLLASWATPTTRDWKDGSYQPNVPENSLLGRQVWQATGAIATGSTAPTGSGDRLNPEHSRWLMGYPTEWASSAPGYADWSKWQALMLQASSEQRPIESERFEVTETQ